MYRRKLNKLLGKLYEMDENILEYGKLKWKLFQKYGTEKHCPKCNAQLLKSDLSQYKYLCFECDENFYGIEVK